eukprot:contig_22629_g5589
MANDGDAHYFPLLRERSKASLLPGGASSSSRQAAVGFVVTTPSATGADSVTFLAATLEDAQQWVTAIQPWLLPWRDVVASAPACFPGRAWDGGASAVSEEALRVATTACTFAAGAVGAAGGVVKAFGHAMANHAELIRIGEAIPVAGPAFALLASIARQMHRYRGEAGAVAGVVESTAELISLAGTSLGLAVRDGRGGSTAMALEDVLMGVERAAVDIQCFCHSTSQRRKVLFSGAAGPKAIAERLESLRTRLISSCTVHTQQMVSLKSECAGATAPTPWEPPWPFVKGATHADAKMYKNSEVVAALANFFESAQGFSVGVLSGQAGVGKSEAAKCYMREQKGRFSGGVVLVNADDPSVAVKSLQFMSGLPPESVVGSTALKEYLRRNTVTHGRMLLVLDNADALGGADHWLSAWLPVRCDRVDVLLTTRLSETDAGLRAFREALPGVCKVVAVHVLPPEAASRALRRFIGDDHFRRLAADRQEHERLAIDYLAGPRGMDGLLLALALAGRTISTCAGMDAATYAKSFKSEIMALLDEEGDVSVPAESPRANVRASVNLSLCSLHQQSPVALVVLQLLCIFPPDGIPPNIHEVAAEVLSELPKAELRSLCSGFPSPPPQCVQPSATPPLPVPL